MWSPKFFKHFPSLSFRESSKVRPGCTFFFWNGFASLVHAWEPSTQVKAQSHWSHCFLNIFLIAGEQNKCVFLTRLSHQKLNVLTVFSVDIPATSPGYTFTILSRRSHTGEIWTSCLMGISQFSSLTINMLYLPSIPHTQVAWAQLTKAQRVLFGWFFGVMEQGSLWCQQRKECTFVSGKSLQLTIHLLHCLIPVESSWQIWMLVKLLPGLREFGGSSDQGTTFLGQRGCGLPLLWGVLAFSFSRCLMV